jgi:hypothetical protein
MNALKHVARQAGRRQAATEVIVINLQLETRTP